jgi:hypothetical protein
MWKTKFTMRSAIAGIAIFAASGLAPASAHAAIGAFADVAPPFHVTLAKGGGGGGGGGMGGGGGGGGGGGHGGGGGDHGGDGCCRGFYPGPDFGFLDIPQPDFSRPYLGPYYYAPRAYSVPRYRSRIAYCVARFRTYNVYTRHYMGYDGRWHYC